MSRRLALGLLAFNAANLVLWTVMMFVTPVTPLARSTPYTNEISVYALVAAFLIATITSWLALATIRVGADLTEHRRHNRLFHRRVSEALEIPPPEHPDA